MSKGAVCFDESATEWYTPKSIVSTFGEFDYDPATTEEQAKRLNIPNYDTIMSDGLKTDWTKYKRIWINPPFNIKHLFWEKACETVEKSITNIWFLCPIGFLTTKRFHNALDKRDLCVSVVIPNGRIKFTSTNGDKKNAPAFGSVVVSPRACIGDITRIKLDENEVEK